MICGNTLTLDKQYKCREEQGHHYNHIAYNKIGQTHYTIDWEPLEEWNIRDHDIRTVGKPKEKPKPIDYRLIEQEIFEVV